MYSLRYIRYIAQPLLPEAAGGTSPRGAGIPYSRVQAPLPPSISAVAPFPRDGEGLRARGCLRGRWAQVEVRVSWACGFRV